MSQPSQLQKDIAAYLDAHAAFQYVLLMRDLADDDAGDALTEDRMQAALKGQIAKAGKTGLVCAIGMPRTKNNTIGVRGPVEDLELVIQIVEHRGNNRAPAIGTGIRADDLCETVKSFLHQQSLDGLHALVVTGSVPDDELPAHLTGWLITVESRAHGITALPQVARPGLSVAGPVLTVSCPTDNVSVWVTTDGSFPSDSNPDATGMILGTATALTDTMDIGALPSGTRIRAVAYKPGMAGSQCAVKVL